MGGRGSQWLLPINNNGQWSNGLGEQAPQDLREVIGTKGKAKSIGDSVIGTNPYHSYDYREYSENCQRCVVAYELRRRGYDVTAQPTFPGDTLSGIAYMNKRDNTIAAYWRGAFKGARTEHVGVTGNTPKAEQGVIDNITAKMQKYGNGSRAVVQIFYRMGGGHVFNVENQGGRIVWVEAQTGKMKDISKTMGLVQTSSVNLVRVDNLKISDRAKKFVWQKGTKKK